tara:strand:+ start:616 stop:1560 length:945 start_codon:yes stop_codon:yes gene_type:complete
MSEKLNILVTSCGGDIGQSIGKILKKLGHITFGQDINEKTPSKFIYDEFKVGLRVTNKDYLKAIKETIKTNNIQIVIPASEIELVFYSNLSKKTASIFGAKLLIPNHSLIETAIDKKNTCDFLEKNNLPYPVVYDPKKVLITYPCIAKTRKGSGGTNVFIVENENESSFYRKKYNNLIFQELLDGKEGEYTCCCFMGSNRLFRSIILKRDLAIGGYSKYGEVIKNNSITELLLKVSELLNLKGSINVQLRINKGIPTIFEINPRFSSTVLFRHLLGFKDLQWSIEDLIGMKISKYIKPKDGSLFFRGYSEYIEN